ncbi:MAG: baseplate J/gp47 family protein [Bradymonadaceae bacterium]
MSASGVLQIDDQQWELGGGALIDGSVELAEGKRASSVSATIADPTGTLANSIPLVVVEDTPPQKASVEVTFVAEVGREGDVSVPAGTTVRTQPLEQVLDGGAPTRVSFTTDEPLGPSDFGGREDIPGAADRRARATVSATAVEPGAQGNIPGGPTAEEPSNLEVVPPIDGIDWVYNTQPATGGRSAGVRGQKVPVDCWLGPSNSPTPQKVFSGALSQLTASHNRLEVMAVDHSVEARRTERAERYEATTPAALVQRIARRHELAVDLSQAELGDVRLSSFLQHGETDWELLHRVLASAGHRAKVRGETIYVTKVGQTRAFGQTPVIRPEDLTSYSFEVDELTKHTTPLIEDREGNKASNYNPDTGAKARPVQLERVGTGPAFETKPSELSQQELQKLQSEARQTRTFRASLEATELYTRLDTDDLVMLQGFGDRFDGPWWIDSLTHAFAGSTSFELTSDSA